MKAEPATIKQLAMPGGPKVTVDTPTWAWKNKTGTLVDQDASSALVAFSETDGLGKVSIFKIRFPVEQVILDGKRLKPLD